jgi:hypothetical protein
MPERLNRVRIQLASRPDPIVLSWDTRRELIRRLDARDDGASAANAFRAVGASRPARFTIHEKEQLATVVDEWMDDVGRDLLPAGVFELRSALINDLHDAGRGP